MQSTNQLSQIIKTYAKSDRNSEEIDKKRGIKDILSMQNLIFDKVQVISSRLLEYPLVDPVKLY